MAGKIVPGLPIDPAVSEAVLEICFHFTASGVLTSAGQNNAMYSRNAKIYLLTNYLLMTGFSGQKNIVCFYTSPWP